MAKNDTSNTDKAPLPQESVSPAAKEKHRTVGNWVYDWVVYTTFAWGGVAVASAASAHESQHGTSKWFGWLRWINDKSISGLRNLLQKIPVIPKRNILHYAKGTTMFLTLGLGGWLMTAPIKWLEDNREKNAARIDRALGTKEPDPSVIEAEIPQTWHSVLSGRLLSWGLSYVAFLAMPPKIAERANHFFGDLATKGWMQASKWLNKHPKEATVRKWAKIAAFDALFTVITASVTYAYSRYVARKDYEVDHHQPATPETSPPATHPADGGNKSFADRHPAVKRSSAAPPALHRLKVEHDPVTPSLG